MVACPICDKPVREVDINRHIDSECQDFVDDDSAAPAATQSATSKAKAAASFFTPAPRRNASFRDDASSHTLGSSPVTTHVFSSTQPVGGGGGGITAVIHIPPAINGVKRAAAEHDDAQEIGGATSPNGDHFHSQPYLSKPPAAKKPKTTHAPLAERMRPQTLDEVTGQSLLAPNGVLRNLILTDHVPSMILWGGPGTGKTTIARLIAHTAGTRFVEINSTSSGVAECKKLFAEARNELGLTGRRTIIFCDEIHRFSKSQLDVFLGPVEAGHVTLIGATTENPSFKVVNALLSRCRTFTLEKLRDADVFSILKRALGREVPGLVERETSSTSPHPAEERQHEEEEDDDDDDAQHGRLSSRHSYHLLIEDDYALLHYLSAFADGDARTALNLLELALDLCQRPNITLDDIKSSLTQTLVYDRAGDQHYDTISAFHKSVRGSHQDAALYYLARMLQSGEDPLYVARRMVVIASEDVGLADSSLLSLATATYMAAEKIGMPECRINLAHCAVALCLAPKSTRAYRGLNAAYDALREPGVAGLPVPFHLRNAPTRLMKEMGYGREYKYNPDYVDGRVVQEYLPEKLAGRTFLGEMDLGEKVDPEVGELNEEVGVEREELDSRETEVLLGPDGD